MSKKVRVVYQCAGRGRVAEKWEALGGVALREAVVKRNGLYSRRRVGGEKRRCGGRWRRELLSRFARCWPGGRRQNRAGSERRRGGAGGQHQHESEQGNRSEACHGV